MSLNESDSVSLEKLPGIGPVLASRIIRYREKLGGFYHRSQLREVYGIDDSLYAFLEPFIETGAEDRLLKKIDLNI
ncbi:MAG: helix-hairpin-helix domain-containing protein, partial [Chitinophagia bacterium]|nr:helix-hairpin-helix domain-containing protein [Chitinophagia bacterium]